jgi:hypothetical protein
VPCRGIMRRRARAAGGMSGFSSSITATRSRSSIPCGFRSSRHSLLDRRSASRYYSTHFPAAHAGLPGLCSQDYLLYWLIIHWVTGMCRARRHEPNPTAPVRACLAFAPRGSEIAAHESVVIPFFFVSVGGRHGIGIGIGIGTLGDLARYDAAPHVRAGTVLPPLPQPTLSRSTR